MLAHVFEILESTPAKLSVEIANLSDTELRARPMPGKWSILEVLAHLDDVEELGMRARVAAIVERERPVLQPFDQERRAEEQGYAKKNVRDVLESFRKQRKANVAWLRTLNDAQLRRIGTHAQVGEISAGDFLYEWAFHDLGHLKQILEIKRYALWPRMGNMQKFYSLLWGEPK